MPRIIIMTTKTYSLYDGKYTIVYEEGPQIKEILRHNTTWKTIDDVAGDNVLRLLFDRVLELEKENKELKEQLNK
jgi:hypothetical protein